MTHAELGIIVPRFEMLQIQRINNEVEDAD